MEKSGSRNIVPFIFDPLTEGTRCAGMQNVSYKKCLPCKWGKTEEANSVPLQNKMLMLWPAWVGSLYANRIFMFFSSHVLFYSCVFQSFQHYDYLAWGRENLVLFVRLFDLRSFSFVCFLFFLVSGKGCGLWLWHSLDFTLTHFFLLIHSPY